MSENEDFSDGRAKPELSINTFERDGNTYRASDGRLISQGEYQHQSETGGRYTTGFDILEFLFKSKNYTKIEKIIFRTTFVVLFIVATVVMVHAHSHWLATIIAPVFLALFVARVLAATLLGLIRVAIFLGILCLLGYLAAHY